MDQEGLQEIRGAVLGLVPQDGSIIGNNELHRNLNQYLGYELSEGEYWLAHTVLVEDGVLRKGRGRGGSVYLRKVQAGSTGERKGIARLWRQLWRRCDVRLSIRLENRADS